MGYDVIIHSSLLISLNAQYKPKILAVDLKFEPFDRFSQNLVQVFCHWILQKVHNTNMAEE